MQFATKSSNPEKSRSQCLIVGLYEGDELTPTAQVLDKASAGHIKKILGRGDLSGKLAQTLMVQDVPGINSPRLLLVGLGKKSALNGKKFNQALIAAIRVIKATKAENAYCCLLEAETSDQDIYWRARRIVEQLESGYYQFTEMKGKPKAGRHSMTSVDIYLDKSGSDRALVRSATRLAKKGVADGQAVAIGTNAAKDLGNRPGNVCTPTHLADEAIALAKKYRSLTTKVLNEAQMKKLGMGSLLSVGQGSAEASKLIIMEHKGGKAGAKPHVLVGKGITFDTGGISLKPGAGMHEMIYDMCGAATVFGAMKAVAEQNLAMNVIVVIAAAENMPSDRASRPGDIVKSMSGQTIEILNTDAEGRLVLCDALTYVERFDPASVIDVATLTGACVIALGSVASAVYANDDQLAEDINNASVNSLDPVWRMPLWDEYQPQINTAHADMANIGGREAGSITAACFLSRFTKKYKWAHLDVAGTAFRGSGSSKGATGRPVGVLTQYLMDRAAD